MTTVDLNLGELGRVAATELLRAIGAILLEGGARLLPCRLVVRQSTESPVLARPNGSAAVLQRRSSGVGG